ncbi:DUF883 family protein [Salipiger bermudensis]|uniref:DUF883 family protein n=1 Tax=Salipiger bermudensis TaxID=344736 RepID=UPI001C994608|nr:DUF883 domain-containing protein [Salipiger bermudensis]MBY6002696.1 DUF883 family protein [Salipiger bermudensis]
MANTTANTPTSTGASTSMSSKDRDLDALSDQIATLRKDLSSLTEMVGDIGTRRGREAKAKARAKAEDVRGQGEEMLRDAGRRVAEFEDQAIGQIRATPLQAVGIAAAAGFLLGYLNSRR